MIQLTVYVDDITAVMTVFTHIRLYTSSEENGSYTHLDYIPLVAGRSTYDYTHVVGTPDTWYRSSYWSVAVESSLSDSVQGADAELYHYPIYPTEVSFSTSEQNLVRKIRRLIGDVKGLGNLYTDGTEFCSSILGDGKTMDLGEKGWPVYISINDVEYTTLDDPIVQGYQYLTFSGTLNSGVQNDVVNIWYYTFKFSDREVYEAYGDAMIPPFVPADCVSQDHLMLQAAIDLLVSMYAEDMVDDGASIRDDMTLYDPSPGLRERDKLLKHLRKQLDGLVQECVRSSMLGLAGVLID